MGDNKPKLTIRDKELKANIRADDQLEIVLPDKIKEVLPKMGATSRAYNPNLLISTAAQVQKWQQKVALGHTIRSLMHGAEYNPNNRALSQLVSALKNEDYFILIEKVEFGGKKQSENLSAPVISFRVCKDEKNKEGSTDGLFKIRFTNHGVLQGKLYKDQGDYQNNIYGTSPKIEETNKQESGVSGPGNKI